MDIFLFVILILIAVKTWKAIVEFHPDTRFVHKGEPWYWFIFFNLCLTMITSHYDYQFIGIGLVLQLALSAWFAVSVRWIIHACPHKTGVMLPSWFVKGKSLKFCYRCGTRLSKEAHAHWVKDSSWTYFLFQMPPHLLKYVGVWLAQSVMVLVSLFLVLRILKKPELQQEAIGAMIFLVLLVPPFIYFLGRFRRYLSETRGLIWWADLKNSFAAWVFILIIFWAFVRFFLI